MLGIDGHNPYRLFFSFSLAGVISGLSLFIFSYSGVSIFWHRELMITLFLMPAATGFLFTASPRFLVTAPAKDHEIWIAAFLYTSLFVCFFFQLDLWFIGLKWILIGWVALFFGRRWWPRKTKNPYWPPFILASFLAGFIGVSIQLIERFISVDASLSLLGHSLYFDAMFWILLFGIGIKFFPMLTGAAAPVYHAKRRSLLTKDQYESNTLWFSVAFLGLMSFVLPAIGLWMRALLILFMAYEGWGIFEKPLRKGFITTFLKIFLFTIVAAHFIFPFYSGFLVHVYHVVFVAGFLSITMMVESRVLLSHEQKDIVVEQKSPWILTAFILFYISMITRVTAVFISGSYVHHLQYASLAAVAGVILILVQLKRSFYPKHSD